MELISAFIGAIIGGLFSLGGVWLAHKNDLKKEQEREKLLLKGFLLSIRDEIETLWDRYMWGIGEVLEKLPEKSPLLYFYPLTQSYFTVYDDNSSLIGKIEDNDLRKLIIITYAKAKGLVDGYRFNNEMVQKYENLNFLYQQTNNPTIGSQAKAALAGLVEYADGIKKQHLEIKNSVAELLRKLSNI